MRDRLIKLFKSFNVVCIKPCLNVVYGRMCKDCRYEQIADYLLENGVIVLPCKVGQRVYVIHNTVERIELGLPDCIYETVIDSIHLSGTIEYHLYYKKIVHSDCDFFTEKDIGKTVFFSKEGAVQALKGGAE